MAAGAMAAVGAAAAPCPGPTKWSERKQPPNHINHNLTHGFQLEMCCAIVDGNQGEQGLSDGGGGGISDSPGAGALQAAQRSSCNL